MRRLTAITALAAVAAAALWSASLAPARVASTSNFGYSNGVTAAFRASAQHCLGQYISLGGLAKNVFDDLLHSRLPVALQPPSTGHSSFAVLERFKPTGELVIKVEWAPGEHGTYPLDGAPQVPCAILLHEMRHAADMDSGVINGNRTESFDPSVFRDPAALRQSLYVEGRGVQAENFYLWHRGLKQRRHYGLFRLKPCVSHPESRGSYYFQGCLGTFILPNWVVWH